MRRAGTYLIIAGIALFIISIAFIKNYIPGEGLIYNLLETDLVIKEESEPDIKLMPEPRNKLNLVDDAGVFKSGEEIQFDPWWKGKISFPYRYFFSIDMLLIFTGVLFKYFLKDKDAVNRKA